MRYLGLCAAAVALLAAGSARAQAQDQTSDLRCVIVFASMVGNPQYAQLKDSASAGLFYFLGRAEGRQPGMDLATQLKRVREELIITQYPDEGRRCFAALKQKNDQLKALGDAAQQAKRGVG
jgi:hypothetical protein